MTSSGLQRPGRTDGLHDRNSTAAPAGFALLLVLAALNLRPAITSVSPLLDQIEASYGLGPRTSILVVALPVCVLGLGAPLTPWLSARLGRGRAVAVGLAAIAVGLGIRALWTPWLFPATIAVALGITVVAVSLPAVVKTHAAAAGGRFTAVYAVAMAAGAALAPAVTGWFAQRAVPLEISLGTWAVLAAVAAVAWSLPGWERTEPRSVRRNGFEPVAAVHRVGRALPPRALPLAAFFGVQALLFFLIVAQLPRHLQRLGMSPATAGAGLAAFSAIGLLGSLLVPLVAGRLRDQRGIVLVCCALSAAGFLALGPFSQPWLAIVLLGLGQASIFPLAITLFVLRAESPADAATLSTLAQSAGFALAALGLWLIVQLTVTDTSGSTQWWIALGLVIVQTVVGLRSSTPAPNAAG